MTTPPVGARVIIAVPTFRRPAQLAALLPRLLDQIDSLATDPGLSDVRAGVLVVDNDPDRSGRVVADDHQPDRVRYVAESRPGVVAVRNRVLAETADCDAVIFLDDDQTPTSPWLSALLGVWRTSSPAAVAGPVVSELPDDLDPWIRDGGFFDRRYRSRLRTGAAIAEVATTNLLLDTAAVRERGLAFDPRFGLSGGEDSLFTRSLSGSGGTIVWCAEAAVRETLPADRLTRRWVCRRALSSGNTAARVDLALAGSPVAAAATRLRLLARGGVRLLLGGVGVVAGAATRSRGRSARSTRSAYRGLGLLLGALDVSYQEYRRTGSRLVIDPVRRPATRDEGEDGR